MSRRWLVTAYLLLGITALCTLSWPMGRDQGIFAWTGNVILHGGVPYRDAWEVKGPAAHYSAALAIALFGHNQWGIHLLDLLLTLAGMAALWNLCIRLADRFAAHLAVILYLLWYWGLGYWHAAQPDAMLGVFQLLALALLLENKRAVHPWRMALGGACLAVAMLYKLPFGLLFFAIIPAGFQGSQELKRSLKSLLAGIMGYAAPVAITAIWFAHKGALRDLLDVQFLFNWQVHRGATPLSITDHIHAILYFLMQKGAIFVIAGAFIGLVFAIWKESRWSAVAAVFVLATDAVCVALQKKYFPYHWIPALGPLAILAALGASRVNAAIAEKQEVTPPADILRSLMPIILWIVLLWNALPIFKYIGVWIPSVAHLRSWDAYERSVAGQTFIDQKQVAQYVEQRTTASDTVLQWGFDPLINYLAQRAAPTQFGFNYALIRSTGDLKQKWRRQFMSDLEAHPPAYLVIALNDKNVLMEESSVAYMKDFPEFDRYVHDHFEKETVIGDYEIWRNKTIVH